MSEEQILDKPFVKVAVEGGRKNWVATFSVRMVREHVERLLDHHSRRLIDEEKAAKANRDLLVEATRTAVIPDPNRTVTAVDEKQRLERTQSALDGAVRDRKARLGEFARWMLFLKQKGDDRALLLTLDDLTYFRMGKFDLDSPDDEFEDY